MLQFSWEEALTLAITPLSDALGAEVTGIDLTQPVDPADVAAMEDALTEHLVLVIRDQKFTPAQYLAALRLFGDTMRQHLTDMLMPDHPEIAVLDSAHAKTVAGGVYTPLGSREWHTDHTNHARPPKITALYAVKLPKSGGGDTGFANMQSAYAGLPPKTRDELAKLKTVNTIEDRAYVSAEDKKKFGVPQVHPLIRTHPVSGRKAIYVHPGKLAKIDGMAPDESQDFVGSLLDRVLQPQITYRHKWRVGDMLLCDNRAVMHIAHRDYDPLEGRIMHRVLLQGDVPA
jgi:taurine dioxygenase